ncbi:MFS transporter [Bacteroidota bacterium]
MEVNKRKLYLDKNLRVVFSITLISLMGVASLTPAFPGIGKAFNITPKEVGLLITMFTLPGIFLTPVLGVFADRYGRKRIIIPSLILFGIAGTLCFFTRDFQTLVILRFLQGVGAASLGAINLTIIGDLFTGRDRAAAMGYNSSVISVATAFYPVIGGVLATIAWYYPFLLPLLSFGVALLVLTSLNNPEPKNVQSLKRYFIDTFKSVANIRIVGLLILSVLTFIILYGPYLTYLPFIVGDTFRQPPYVIGIIMSFASVASFFTSANMGRLTKYFPESKLIIISCFFYFFSMILVPILNNVWLLIIPSMLFGIAQGMNLPSIMSLLASVAPMNQRGAIMSLNGMVFRIGQTLGPLIILPVYGIWGIDGAYNLGGIVAVLMLIISLLMLGKKN